MPTACTCSRAGGGSGAGASAGGTAAAELPPGFAIVREDVQNLSTGGVDVHYQVIRGEPALTEADVASAAVVPGRDPEVVLTFTPEGEAAFERLTRTLAQDGALMRRLQAFAIVVDGTLVTSPTLDYREYPAGIDGGKAQAKARPGVSATQAAGPRLLPMSGQKRVTPCAPGRILTANCPPPSPGGSPARPCANAPARPAPSPAQTGPHPSAGRRRRPL